MNQPLGHPPGFPVATWAPPPLTAPPPPGAQVERLLQGLRPMIDLMLPLLVGLAGALSTWVILEVLRARHGRRALLPGRPPVWGQPVQRPPGMAPRRRKTAPAPVSRAAVATISGKSDGSRRPLAPESSAAPPVRYRKPP